jgi:hypothetical protein
MAEVANVNVLKSKKIYDVDNSLTSHQLSLKRILEKRCCLHLNRLLHLGENVIFEK